MQNDYFHNYLWSSSTGPAAFTINLTNRKQAPCAPLASLTTSGAGDKEVLKRHHCEHYTEENERSKTLKNESLSPLTPSQLGKWCKKYKRTSWAHLCPAPTVPTVAASAIIIANVCWAPCILIPVSCSWFLQVERVRINLSRLPHSTTRCWNFPTDYGPLCMDRLWFLCMDLHTTLPLGVWGVLLVLQMSQMKWSPFKCSLNPLHSFSKWEPLAHTLFRAFHHAGWHWLLWLLDSTCLIT